MPGLDNHEIALRRATFWLSALIAELEIDPADTNVRLSLRGAGEEQLVQVVNLAEDLAAFSALGARSDLFQTEEAE